MNTTDKKAQLENDIELAMDFELDEMEDVEDELINDNHHPEADIQLLEDIVNECCGFDEQGSPKAAITFTSEMWMADGSNKRTLTTQSIHKPEIQIRKRLQFVQIDIVFPSYVDVELKTMWNALERFGRALHEVDDAATEVPLFTVVIVPIARNGVYYITCSNPLFWALQASKPGERTNAIRLFFHGDDMGFYESDEIDMQEVDAIAERMAQQANAEVDALERKQREQDEFLEERNRRLEELRRKGNAN